MPRRRKRNYPPLNSGPEVLNLKDHVTYVKFGAAVNLTRCEDRKCGCDRIHCPFCSVKKYKPERQGRVRDHLHQSHFKHAIILKDREVMIVKCYLNCAKAGHFHCPYCPKLLLKKIGILYHIKSHLQRVGKPTSAVEAPNYKHPETVLFDGQEIELCSVACEDVLGKHYHCPLCDKKVLEDVGALSSHLWRCRVVGARSGPASDREEIWSEGRNVNNEVTPARERFGEQWHPSIVRNVVDLPMLRCEKAACCRKRFHCALCPKSKFKPTYPAHLKEHYLSHWNSRTDFGDYSSLVCYLPCLPGTGKDKYHFHCPKCGTKRRRKDQFTSHVHDCMNDELKQVAVQEADASILVIAEDEDIEDPGTGADNSTEVILEFRNGTVEEVNPLTDEKDPELNTILNMEKVWEVYDRVSACLSEEFLLSLCVSEPIGEFLQTVAIETAVELATSPGVTSTPVYSLIGAWENVAKAKHMLRQRLPENVISSMEEKQHTKDTTVEEIGTPVRGSKDLLSAKTSRKSRRLSEDGSRVPSALDMLSSAIAIIDKEEQRKTDMEPDKQNVSDDIEDPASPSKENKTRGRKTEIENEKQNGSTDSPSIERKRRGRKRKNDSDVELKDKMSKTESESLSEPATPKRYSTRGHKVDFALLASGRKRKEKKSPATTTVSQAIKGRKSFRNSEEWDGKYFGKSETDLNESMRTESADLNESMHTESEDLNEAMRTEAEDLNESMPAVPKNDPTETSSDIALTEWVDNSDLDEDNHDDQDDDDDDDDNGDDIDNIEGDGEDDNESQVDIRDLVLGKDGKMIFGDTAVVPVVTFAMKQSSVAQLAYKLMDNESEIKALPKMHCCSLCEVECLSFLDLVHHYCSDHDIDESLHCEECRVICLDETKKMEHASRCRMRSYSTDHGQACPVCEFTSSEFTSVTDHLLYQHNSAYVRCDICEATFTKQKSLDIHLALKHGPKQCLNRIEKNLTKCESCSFEAEDFASLTSHLMSEHKQTTYRCDVCEKAFVDLNEFVLHLQKLHGPAEEHLRQCKICGMVFKKHSDLVQHRVHSHNQPKNIKDDISLQCKACFFIASSVDEIRQHRNQHKGGNFKCPHCGMMFPIGPKLKIHIEDVHIYPDGVSCELCGKKFKSIRYLTDHMKRHQGNKQFSCASCGKKFFDKSSLKMHEETHRNTSERNYRYVCAYCGQRYNSKSNFDDHMNKHTGQKPYKCNQCDKTFGFRSQLAQHKVFLHTTLRPYQCPDCDKAFKLPAKLRAHRATHGDNRKFSCQICKRILTSEASIKSHSEKCKMGILKRIPVPQPLVHSNTAMATDSMVEMAVESYVIVNSNEDVKDIQLVSQVEGQHIENDGQIVDGPAVFACSVCNQEFEQYEAALEHINSAHEESVAEGRSDGQTDGQMMDTVIVTEREEPSVVGMQQLIIKTEDTTDY